MNLELTKKFEGFVPTIYKDTKGKRTIGYGFNLDDSTVAKNIPWEVKSGLRPMAQSEADKVFNILYSRAQNDAVKFVGKDNFTKLSPAVQDTITDMSYNMGYNKLSGFQNFKKALIAGDMNKAAYELKDSNWYNQVGNRSKYHYNIVKNAKPVLQWNNILSAAGTGGK